MKISGDAELCGALKVCAVEDGDSIGALIRRILRGYLRNRKKRARAIAGSGPRRDAVGAGGLATVVRSIHAWIDEEDLRSLTAFAVEDGETVTELIRRVLFGYVVARRSHASGWPGGSAA